MQTKKQTSQKPNWVSLKSVCLTMILKKIQWSKDTGLFQKFRQTKTKISLTHAVNSWTYRKISSTTWTKTKATCKRLQSTSNWANQRLLNLSSGQSSQTSEPTVDSKASLYQTHSTTVHSLQNSAESQIRKWSATRRTKATTRLSSSTTMNNNSRESVKTTIALKSNKMHGLALLQTHSLQSNQTDQLRATYLINSFKGTNKRKHQFWSPKWSHKRRKSNQPYSHQQATTTPETLSASALVQKSLFRAKRQRKHKSQNCLHLKP